MQNNRPLVSIVTPAFNAQHLLPETAASVVQQSYSNYEHIIVDDRSLDNTRALISELASMDSRIRPVYLDENVGPVKARNRGIELARGKYVAFLDADDLWLPEKLGLQLALMEDTNCAMSFTDYRHMSADGSKVGSIVRGPNELGLAMHYRTRYLCCSSVMVNRLVVPNLSFPAIAPAVRAEDFIVWARILRQHGWASRCPHDVVRYRLVPRSRSSSKLTAVRSVWHLYRAIERMSLPVAAYNFTCFAFAASIKHVRSRPRFDRAKVDALLVAPSTEVES